MGAHVASVERAGDRWHVGIPRVGGTRVRRLSDVEQASRELIAHQLGVPAESFALTVQVRDPIPDLADQVAQAREQAERAKFAAEALMRGAARRYSEAGLSTRDIASLLGVSQAWVSVMLSNRWAAA